MPHDVQIVSAAVAAGSSTYTVPGTAELRLKAVSASFTDNGAASAWLPAVLIVSDSGHVIARALDTGVSVTAGGSADVSWFPGLNRVQAGAAGAGATVNRYTTNDTWTKPASSVVRVVCVGAGGGGGAGVTAAGLGFSAGGGGGGGSVVFAEILASSLPATVAVTVGAGGSVGAGLSGTDGGASSFGSYCVAYGGGGGQLGQNSAIAHGGAGASTAQSATGSTAGTPASAAGVAAIGPQGASGAAGFFRGVAADWGGASGSHSSPTPGQTVAALSGGGAIYGGRGGGAGATGSNASGDGGGYNYAAGGGGAGGGVGAAGAAGVFLGPFTGGGGGAGGGNGAGTGGNGGTGGTGSGGGGGGNGSGGGGQGGAGGNGYVLVVAE